MTGSIFMMEAHDSFSFTSFIAATRRSIQRGICKKHRDRRACQILYLV